MKILCSPVRNYKYGPYYGYNLPMDVNISDKYGNMYKVKSIETIRDRDGIHYYVTDYAGNILQYDYQDEFYKLGSE